MIPHNKPTIGFEEIESVILALKNNTLTSGEIVRRFENDFSKFIGLPAIATSSGTHAIHLALLSLGINQSDEVIVPTYTCPSVVLPILYQQAKPKFADIDEDFNISLNDLNKLVTKKTKALIVPHMFGFPAKIEEIKEFCDDKSIFLIEDCAQSIGSTYDNKLTGTFGDVSCYSFYATKMITSIKGGMVCTNDAELHEKLNSFLFSEKPQSEMLSNITENDISCSLDTKITYSYNMSDIEAAVGSVQLKKLEGFIKIRRKIANYYRERLENCILPFEDDRRKHVYMRFVIRTDKNNFRVLKKMNERSVSSTIIHAPLLHKRTLFKKYAVNQQFPCAEKMIEKLLSLPIYPSMTETDLEYTVKTLNEILGQ